MNVVVKVVVIAFVFGVSWDNPETTLTPALRFVQGLWLDYRLVRGLREAHPSKQTCHSH